MPKRILLVEDDRVMADVLGRSLQRAGFAVKVTRNGLEAREVCHQETFDVIVTDYQMPKMSGEEFVRELRLGAVNRDVPVVFVTGKGLELDTEQLCREIGVFEFVSKPFGPRHLIEVVQNCLAQESETAGRRGTGP